MKTRKFTRRQVIATTSAGAIGTMINWPLNSFGGGSYSKEKLAVNGGAKVHIRAMAGMACMGSDS